MDQASIKTVTELLGEVDASPDEAAADAELRQSFLANDWMPTRPMIVDEHGITICGHRRARIAAELGVTPVVETVNFGEGEDADAKRLRTALADNSGNSNRTAAQRKRYARYYYAQGRVSGSDGQIKTQQQIADMLGVSQRQISEDLKDFNLEATSKSNPKTEANPKGAGRPKGSGSKSKGGGGGGSRSRRSKADEDEDNGNGRTSTRGRSTPKLDEARAIVRKLLDADEPISPHKLQEKHGISHVTFDMAIAAELGRREGLAEANHGETMVSIHVLIEKLVPLLEEITEQAKRHLGVASLGAIRIAASECRRLLDGWASGDESIPRVRGHVVPKKRPRRRKEP